MLSCLDNNVKTKDGWIKWQKCIYKYGAPARSGNIANYSISSSEVNCNLNEIKYISVEEYDYEGNFCGECDVQHINKLLEEDKYNPTEEEKHNFSERCEMVSKSKTKEGEMFKWVPKNN